MKRIAVISYHTCPLSDEKDAEIGGMNTYVLEMTKALANKGFVVDVYTRCVDEKSLKVVNVSPNLRVIHLKAGKPVYIPKKELIYYTKEFSQNLFDFIKEERLFYDLISAHYYLSGIIGMSLKRYLNGKIPLVITFHTLALMKNLVARSEDEKEDIQRIKSELQLVKRCDKIIATSKSDIEYIHSLYACPLKKISLLSPGVDLGLFKPINKSKAKSITGTNSNHKIILFVGRITPLKGIDVLLYALKLLIQKNPQQPLYLWVVGEWSEEFKRLQKITKLLKISGNVKFVGQKSREQLPYYYNSAEVLVMPSYYESFGIVALEAMACAVPVIVSDATGISGLLDKEHSHLLTPASNPIALANKIKNILSNKNNHSNLSQEVYQKVQNMGWNNVAEKFNQIVNNL